MTCDNLTDTEYGFMGKYAVALLVPGAPSIAPALPSTEKLVDVAYTEDHVAFSLERKGFVVVKDFDILTIDGGTRLTLHGVYLTEKGVELANTIYEFRRL